VGCPRRHREHALVMLWALLACRPVSIDLDDTGVEDEPDLTDEVYDLEHLLRVDIEMSEDDWDALRYQSRTFESTIGKEDCQERPFDNPFTWFEAAVTVDGERYERVEVRKKGFLGSMSTEKPALKVDLGEFGDFDYKGQRRLTLNNSVSDPSFVRQCLSYSVFTDAGMAAPRCNLAVVTVNGQDMGVYVNVEPVKKPMRERHYEDGDGNLYEGTLSDFREGWTGTFEKKNNETEDDWSDLEGLVEAAGADDDELIEALDEVLDLDQFNRFWAGEVLVMHGDGYASNTNNFFIYNDPSDGRFDFLPWGVDGTFYGGEGQEQPVYANSLLTNRLIKLDEGEERYVEGMRWMLDNAWDEGALEDQVAVMASLIEDEVDNWNEVEEQQDVVMSLIEDRRGDLEEALERPLEWPGEPRDSYCFVEFGQADASFSTEWGSLLTQDAFSYGDSDLLLDFDDGTVLDVEGSAVVGESEGAAIFYFPSWISETEAIIVYVSTDPANVDEGEITLDLGASGIGALFYMDTETMEDFEFTAYILGTLTLDQAGTDAGDPVSGDLDGTFLSFG
jgi:hypothetical protein